MGIKIFMFFAGVTFGLIIVNCLVTMQCSKQRVEELKKQTVILEKINKKVSDGDKVFQKWFVNDYRNKGE